MKIFVSWSGKRSRAIAELISDWLKCVIQASQPWISTRDIDRGAIWFSEINDKLKDVSVGIVCLTQENKDKPWILFETGALTKGLTTNRVCTFLIDLQPSDLQDPLAQFNHTLPESSSVWELVRTINNCLDEKSLDERILRQVFDTYWDQFDKKFKLALTENPLGEVSPPRSEEDILSEILANTRNMARRIRDLEMEVNSKSIHTNTEKHFNPDDDFHLEKRILSMINSGKFSNEELISYLKSQNYSESYIDSKLKKYVSNKNQSLNGKI